MSDEGQGRAEAIVRARCEELIRHFRDWRPHAIGARVYGDQARTIEQDVATLEQFITAALRAERVKALEDDKEYIAMRDYAKSLESALRNCHMLARRNKCADDWQHILRLAEGVGVTSVKGVLREEAK